MQAQTALDGRPAAALRLTPATSLAAAATRPCAGRAHARHAPAGGSVAALAGSAVPCRSGAACCSAGSCAPRRALPLALAATWRQPAALLNGGPAAGTPRTAPRSSALAQCSPQACPAAEPGPGSAATALLLGGLRGACGARRARQLVQCRSHEDDTQQSSIKPKALKCHLCSDYLTKSTYEGHFMKFCKKVDGQLQGAREEALADFKRRNNIGASRSKASSGTPRDTPPVASRRPSAAAVPAHPSTTAPSAPAPPPAGRPPPSAAGPAGAPAAAAAAAPKAQQPGAGRKPPAGGTHTARSTASADRVALSAGNHQQHLQQAQQRTEGSADYAAAGVAPPRGTPPAGGGRVGAGQAPPQAAEDPQPGPDIRAPGAAAGPAAAAAALADSFVDDGFPAKLPLGAYRASPPRSGGGVEKRTHDEPGELERQLAALVVQQNRESISPTYRLPSCEPLRGPDWREDDPYVSSLTPEALAFFQQRGISERTLRDNRIFCAKSVCPSTGQVETAIAFPYFKGNIMVHVKFRAVDRKAFWSTKGTELCVYGFDDVAGRGFPAVFVVEGEMDRLALYEAGVVNAVSVPNGAPPARMNSVTKRLEQTFAANPDAAAPAARTHFAYIDSLLACLGPPKRATITAAAGFLSGNSNISGSMDGVGGDGAAATTAVTGPMFAAGGMSAYGTGAGAAGGGGGGEAGSESVAFVLATDADPAGQALREELMRRLGRERCWEVATWHNPSAEDDEAARLEHEIQRLEAAASAAAAEAEAARAAAAAAAEAAAAAHAAEAGAETVAAAEAAAAREAWGPMEAASARAQAELQRLKQTVPGHRKDANEVLMKDGAAVLRLRLEEAQPAKVPGLVTVGEYRDQILSYYLGTDPRARGVFAGWPCIDPYYRVAPGELTIVTGVPNSGKSEWLEALAVNLAELYGWAFGLCSLEKAPFDLIKSLVEKRARKPIKDAIRYIPGLSTKYERVPCMALPELAGSFAWVLDHFHLIRKEGADGDMEQPTIDWVLAKAQVLVCRYGIRGLIIDPYNELDSRRRATDNETDFIRDMLTRVRKFARQADVHVWFVAHPRKQQAFDDHAPGMYDISGSAHWFNKTDNGIVVHRRFQKMKDPDGKLRRIALPEVDIKVQKVRNKDIGTQGEAYVLYDKVTGRYGDPREVLEPYGSYSGHGGYGGGNGSGDLNAIQRRNMMAGHSFAWVANVPGAYTVDVSPEPQREASSSKALSTGTSSSSSGGGGSSYGASGAAGGNGNGSGSGASTTARARSLDGGKGTSSAATSSSGNSSSASRSGGTTTTANSSSRGASTKPLVDAALPQASRRPMPSKPPPPQPAPSRAQQLGPLLNSARRSSEQGEWIITDQGAGEDEDEDAGSGGSQRVRASPRLSASARFEEIGPDGKVKEVSAEEPHQLDDEFGGR